MVGSRRWIWRITPDASRAAPPKARECTARDASPVKALLIGIAACMLPSMRSTARTVSRHAAAILALAIPAACGPGPGEAARQPAPTGSQEPAEVRVAGCPDGTRWDGAACSTRQPTPPPTSTAEGEPPGSNDQAEAPSPQPPAVSRPGRPTQPRQAVPIATEIRALESLFAATPRSSPDRVQLARRLAESCVELELASERDGSASAATDARKNAIRYYIVVRDEYPSYSKLDEVLYYLAYEYEREGDPSNARKAYFELIQKTPQSKFVPNAYLGFGELFFQESQSDPSKLELAKQAYLEVIKFPPPDNRAYGYANYKLAYVFWNQGGNNGFAKSLMYFKKAIDFGMQFASLPNAQVLTEAARKDITHVYALAGRPDRAWDFFRPLSGDSGAETAGTTKMVLSLGRVYVQTGHSAEAEVVYTDLARRQPATCSTLLRQIDELARPPGQAATLQSLRRKVSAQCGAP